MWDEGDLNQVLSKGCGALNIEFSEGLRGAVVHDAYGNVGLVQRLAEQVCLSAGVREEQAHHHAVLDVGLPLEQARATVSSGMKARYDGFADNFVRASGLAMAEAGDARRLLHEHGDVYRAQLVAARWIDGYLERRKRGEESPTFDARFEEVDTAAWRDIAAHLRQGDFLPGGRLYEDEQKRKPDED